MDLTVANVYGLLLRSKLLAADAARAMYARWRDEAGPAVENVARFAAWMVAQGYLTDYQASVLARGHADGFFLGEYTVLDRIGSGRMAGVYRAKHRLGGVVAIKVLPPSKAKDPVLLARFQREARLALRFDHANVVRAFEVGQAGKVHYLVMEYLDGETLEEVLLRRGRVRPDEAVHVVYQALQGLQHIHEKGVVHRDLKPGNLMLVPGSGTPGDLLGVTVKLLDIGLGRAMVEDGEAGEFDEGLTGEGVLLGTPDYMAPEQARDAHEIDIRADIYSLGCVLYHLLTGQPPFPDTNVISQMIRHAREPARPLADFNPDVPPGLQQIVNWMMAKEPAGRYATPDRAAQALRIYLVAGLPAPVEVGSDPRMRPFLDWLDENRKSELEPPAGPVPTPAPATQPTLDVSEPPAEPPRRKKPRQAPRPTTPPPLPESSGETPVPVAAPPPPGLLTKRELLLFALGVGCGAVATFLGCLLALRGRG